MGFLAISSKRTSGAVAEPFRGGQILAQESHSRPPPTGVNGYFRERLPPRRDQRHPEDRKFTFGMRNSLHDSTSRCPLTALGNAICRVNGNKTQPVKRHVLDFIGFWKSLKQRHLECVRLGAYLRCKRVIIVITSFFTILVPGQSLWVVRGSSLCNRKASGVIPPSK